MYKNPCGNLFMVFRMEKRNGIISWIRVGRAMKNLHSAINLCDKQQHTAYVEAYPGGRIMYDTLHTA